MSSKGRGVIWTSLAALVVVVGVGGWFWLRHSLRREVYRAVEKLERDSKGTLAVKIGEVAVDPIRRQATLSGVTITIKEGTGEPVTMQVAAIHVKKWERLQSESEVLREQAVDWHGVRSAQLDRYIAQGPPAVQKLLGEGLTLEVSHHSTFRPDRQNEVLMEAVVSTPKLGELSTHFLGSGIDLPKLEQLKREAGAAETSGSADPALQSKFLAAFAEAKIHGARLVLRDSGAMDLVLAMVSTQRGLTAVEARQHLLNDLQSACGRVGTEEWTRPLCVPLAAFIQQPKSLRLTAEPPAPVPAGSLGMAAMGGGGLQAIVSALNVKLAANQD